MITMPDGKWVVNICNADPGRANKEKVANRDARAQSMLVASRFSLTLHPPKKLIEHPEPTICIPPAEYPSSLSS